VSLLQPVKSIMPKTIGKYFIHALLMAQNY
jgi:hypothetical protein